jgi:hypothetical protein
MREQKKYIKRSGLKEGNHLEVSVYYSKGGMSYLTYKVYPRGYYLSVRPVTLGKGTAGYNLFSGCTRLILETNRYSDKQFGKAVEMVRPFEDELIANVTMEEAV